MRFSSGSTSSAPSTVMSSGIPSSRETSGIPSSRASLADASEVGTPRTRIPSRTRLPRASMNAVEARPEPSPTTWPSSISSRAFSELVIQRFPGPTCISHDQPRSAAFVPRVHPCGDTTSLRSRSLPFRPGELLLGGGVHVLDQEAELLLQLLQRRGGAEGRHADRLSAQANVPLPAEGRELLNGDTRGDRRGENGFPVFRMLAAVVLEDLPGRHAHDAGLDPLGDEPFVGVHAQRQLAPRR